jgi:hypothetical protein
MTTPNQILVDLIPGQATADALAERLRVPMLTIRAICQIHAKDGLLEPRTIAGTLTAWSLTDEGRAIASRLNLQPA